jgi:hypothetical protein
MIKIKPIVLILIFVFIMQACSGTKVLSAWRGEQENIDKFREKHIMVIARTANDHARIAFEEAITLELKARGINATESFKKFPKIYPNKEITEERVNMVTSMLESEGFTGIVITVIKDKEESIKTTHNGVYVGASYGGYPSHYGGFNNYYAYPYAYGSYYNTFGGYIPTSSSTRTVTDYVLETVAYNLDEPSENQLVAITTTSVNDPRKAYKTAAEYADKIMRSLE